MSNKKIEEVIRFGDEHVEHAPRRQSVSEEVTELSGIEATAASKSAWLISITVSIGGFLFGKNLLIRCIEPELTMVRIRYWLYLLRAGHSWNVSWSRVELQ